MVHKVDLTRFNIPTKLVPIKLTDIVFIGNTYHAKLSIKLHEKYNCLRQH